MMIPQFLDQLDNATQPVSLSILTSLMRQLKIRPEDFQERLKFDNVCYLRNLLRRTANYEALFLCFEAGQRTPIHDHAGSACGVKILQGTATETIFEKSPDGWLYATGSRQLPMGGVVGSNDMDIHQLSNLQPDAQRLVTLHIYSPPLGEVGNYSITDNSVIRVTAPTREAVPFSAK